MIEARSNDVRPILHRNLECQVHESRQIGSGQTGDGKSIDILGISELKWMEWVNLTQMTIISTTAGRNPSEEMEWPSWSTKESEMQYLDAISKQQNDLGSFPRQTIQYHGNP